MASKSYIPIIVAALIIGFVVPMFYAPLQAFIAGNWIMLILFGLGVALIAGFFIKQLQVPKIAPKNQAILGAVLLGVFAVTTGMINLGGLQTAAFGPAAITPVTTTPGVTSIATLTACQQAVSSDILGKSATLYVNAYDQEANQPYASVVDVDWYLVKDGTVQPYTDSNAEEAAGFSVGDVVSAYGGNQSYYMDPMENICINAQSFPMDLKVHAIANESTGLKITGFDSTAATALSAGTNLSQEKYDITLGADQEDVFYLKLQVNVSNKAFQLNGLSTLSINDIDDVKPTAGQGFSEIVVPKFLKRPIIAYALNETKDGAVTYTENFTAGWGELWVLDNPVMLHEWDEVKYKFNIIAGSTDPSNNQDPSSSDVALICFLDGSWARAGDGTMQYGIFQNDDNEANIGADEFTHKPLAYSTLCTAIEGV